MGTDELFHKRKRALARKIAIRSAKKHLLIVCEGTKTEPNYFKAFITSADVKIIGEGFNTMSLVEYAKKKANEAISEKLPYDQVWCVFDKDSFSKEQFNTAVRIAQNAGFKTAFSNEAFELWYILHFDYLTTGINRKQYNKKLSKYLKRKYEKNTPDIHEILLSRQETAIHNAKTLLKTHGRANPADMNPATTVHLLVEELNKLKR